MVLPQAIGAGLSVGGGIARAIGANQRGQDFQRIAEAGTQATTEYSDQLRRALAGTQQGVEGLVQDQNQATSGLINAMGPGYRQAIDAAQPQAAQALATAAPPIDQFIPPNFAQGGAGGNVATGMQRALAGRYAPSDQLRQSQLAHTMAQPAMAQQQSQYMDQFTNIGRERGDLSADESLRQALANQQYQSAMNDLAAQIAQAQHSGGLLNALGTTAQNLAGPIAGMGFGAPAPSSIAPPPPGALDLPGMAPQMDPRIFNPAVPSAPAQYMVS